MTKVSIKVISVILCAVMVVGCCFVGCGETLTREQLLERIKTEFPEAHINEKSSEIYFYANEESSESLFINNKYSDISKQNFTINNLKSLNNTKRILNVVMPIFVPEWSSNDTSNFISISEPNDQFTQWNNQCEFYHVGSWAVYALNGKAYGYSSMNIWVQY